ncbi:MAG: efflux RND transporter periplasmic adaptor subunit [bacterium]|nr:efflux RND transporter periplasmic adaptor subunit [bacterium]
MKKKTLFILITVTILAVLAAGFSPGLFKDTGKTGQGTIKTAVAETRDMGSSVLATGIIKPCVGAEVRVGSRVSGIVKRLHVKVGDKVEKGQLLGELDQTEYEARRNEAAAALETVKAELAYARLNMERQRKLKMKNFTSQDKVDAAEKNFEVCKAKQKQAKANLESAEIQLQYTLIKAPISGVVATVSTQEGETVAASFTAPTFVVIIDLERLEVRAYVDETDIGRITEGQTATFTVDTYPGVDFEGKVTAIYPKAEMKDNVVNYISIINITITNGLTLRPEMTTTVNIFQETRSGVLSIPKRAIKREKGKKYVLVLSDGKQEKRHVQAGWTDGKYIEITDGLHEGESIIVNQGRI